MSVGADWKKEGESRLRERERERERENVEDTER